MLTTQLCTFAVAPLKDWQIVPTGAVEVGFHIHYFTFDCLFCCYFFFSKECNAILKITWIMDGDHNIPVQEMTQKVTYF